MNIQNTVPRDFSTIEASNDRLFISLFCSLKNVANAIKRESEFRPSGNFDSMQLLRAFVDNDLFESLC